MSIPTLFTHLPDETAVETSFDVGRVRADFPILRERIHGRQLVYLDNAATSQKPDAVIDAMTHYYRHDNANIHRGVHLLSQRATEDYEAARTAVQSFLHATEAREIVFVRGATEAINLVAQTYGRRNVGAGDEVLITAMEHHSNIVPWQILCEEKNATLRVAPINDAGELMLTEFAQLLGPRTKLVSVAHISNALGSVNPIRQMVRLAHASNIPVLVDGAQAVPHLPVDVQELGCDFYVFSGHKVYGPTGIGVLYGEAALLEEMPPYQGGGEMISSVTFEKTLYNKVPHKFEAGTPDIAGVIGLGAAIAYVGGLGIGAIRAHEHSLLTYATGKVTAIPGVRLVGTAREKAGILSFVMDDIHPHDIGTILDQEGIAVRTGHHCAQPVMDRFGIPATVRASFGLYNTKDEIDALVRGIQKVQEIFGLMAELRDIYQEVILEHAKAPRNYRALGAPARKAEGYNPLCGDRCTVYVAIQGEVIEDIGFQGNGCAISRASASMMTQSLKGKTVSEAENLFHRFVGLATGQGGNGNHAEFGKLAAFGGVAEFPARVKCATLAWHTLQAALHGDREPVTTE